MSSRDTNGGAPPTKKQGNSERGEEDDSPPTSKRDSRKSRENSEPDSETERKQRSSSRRKSRRDSSDSEDEKSHRRKRKSRRRRYSSDESSDSSSDSASDSEEGESESSGSEYSDSESESEGERRERKRREKRRRREKEEERERRKRKKEKEKKRRKKEKERRKKEKRKLKKKEKKERGKKGAVTNLWGKYGVIRETDMWTKRPEFTAWLAEVKQVNLENLANWEEKQMFKQFMEDHNTATFPSKKYYNLDAYYRRQMEKDMKKGIKKVQASERTVFNDEEQRRQELLQAREKHKEEQVMALKHSMQSGMAQAMKEQAQLREEMAYQYKLGNFEAAAAIQRRLDPDAAL
ncbi:hypothetical protein PIB30_037228 [Stylosanthes scabra]|uniref:Vicilin-like seed storage protein At2g18540 n=2 Tax=Stylosanthes scabra TaxID=79078 RepID=A0ABU6QD54_9FABA|nr:hypothetical protein [Stylosanthes scabra]